MNITVKQPSAPTVASLEVSINREGDTQTAGEKLVSLVAMVDIDLALTLTDLDVADTFDNEAWLRIPRFHMMEQTRLLARIIHMASGSYDRPTLRVLYCAGNSGCGRIFTQLYCELFERWEEVLTADVDVTKEIEDTE